MKVSIRVEWDMGHRLPNHDGKCRHLHGHRYVADVTIDGPVIQTTGKPDEGMVVDFGPIKTRIREVIDQHYDHFTLLASSDPIVQVLSPDHVNDFGVKIVEYVPTAENIAVFLSARLGAVVGSLAPGSRLSLRLYETPTSWVETGAI